MLKLADLQSQSALIDQSDHCRRAKSESFTNHHHCVSEYSAIHRWNLTFLSQPLADLSRNRATLRHKYVPTPTHIGLPAPKPRHRPLSSPALDSEQHFERCSVRVCPRGKRCTDRLLHAAVTTWSLHTYVLLHTYTPVSGSLPARNTPSRLSGAPSPASLQPRMTFLDPPAPSRHRTRLHRPRRAAKPQQVREGAKSGPKRNEHQSTALHAAKRIARMYTKYPMALKEGMPPLRRFQTGLRLTTELERHSASGRTHSVYREKNRPAQTEPRLKTTGDRPPRI